MGGACVVVLVVKTVVGRLVGPTGRRSIGGKEGWGFWRRAASRARPCASSCCVELCRRQKAHKRRASVAHPRGGQARAKERGHDRGRGRPLAAAAAAVTKERERERETEAGRCYAAPLAWAVHDAAGRRRRQTGRRRDIRQGHRYWKKRASSSSTRGTASGGDGGRCCFAPLPLPLPLPFCCCRAAALPPPAAAAAPAAPAAAPARGASALRGGCRCSWCRWPKWWWGLGPSGPSRS